MVSSSTRHSAVLQLQQTTYYSTSLSTAAATATTITTTLVFVQLAYFSEFIQVKLGSKAKPSASAKADWYVTATHTMLIRGGQ